MHCSYFEIVWSGLSVGSPPKYRTSEKIEPLY